MIPVFHIEAAQEPDERLNRVVELRTGNVVAVIHAEPGYDRALNFRKTAPPHWSSDSSVLLWQVYGKWFPDALVLLKLEGGKEKWQLDLLKTAQGLSVKMVGLPLKTSSSDPDSIEATICTFSSAYAEARLIRGRKVRDGETSSPTRGTRMLPNRIEERQLCGWFFHR